MTNVEVVIYFFKKSSCQGFRRFYETCYGFFFSKKKSQHTWQGFQKSVKPISPRFQNVGSQTLHIGQFSKAIITQQLSTIILFQTLIFFKNFNYKKVKKNEKYIKFSSNILYVHKFILFKTTFKFL
jgi:hypothetical protein